MMPHFHVGERIAGEATTQYVSGQALEVLWWAGWVSLVRLLLDHLILCSQLLGRCTSGMTCAYRVGDERLVGGRDPVCVLSACTGVAFYMLLVGVRGSLGTRLLGVCWVRGERIVVEASTRSVFVRHVTGWQSLGRGLFRVCRIGMSRVGICFIRWVWCVRWGISAGWRVIGEAGI